MVTNRSVVLYYSKVKGVALRDALLGYNNNYLRLENDADLSPVEGLFRPSTGGLKSLQLEGTAEPVELFYDAYQKAAAFRKIPLEVLRKLEEPMWLLKIVPTEITCLNSDFKKDGYGSRQEYYSYTNQHVKSNELG